LGKMIITPQYSLAEDFSEGLAPAMQNNLWGFIDSKGKFIIQPKYSSVEKGFHRGIARVKKNDVEFYIDNTGKEYLSN
jgi:WG containing repeat